VRPESSAQIVRCALLGFINYLAHGPALCVSSLLIYFEAQDPDIQAARPKRAALSLQDIFLSRKKGQKKGKGNSTNPISSHEYLFESFTLLPPLLQ